MKGVDSGWVAETAKLLGKSERTIRNWAERGRIDGVKQFRPGGHYRIVDEDEFREWRESMFTSLAYSESEKKEELRPIVHDLARRGSKVTVKAVLEELGIPRWQFYLEGWHKTLNRLRPRTGWMPKDAEDW